MTISWSGAAQADLRAIEAYIARNSPRYARSMVQRIIARCRRLAHSPGSGPIVPGYEDAGLREVLEKPYRIIYRIQDQEVEIVAVIHASRELPRGMG